MYFTLNTEHYDDADRKDELLRKRARPAVVVTDATLRVELRWEWHGLDSYRFIFSDNRVIDVLATPFWDGEIDGLPITVVADDGDSEFDTMVPLPEFSGDVDTDRRRLVETVTAVIVAYVAARV